jgi:membrane protein DedA with SNARE-associated domain
MEWLAHIVRYVLVRWGYLALAAGLLGENAGLPLPGETILMYSSFSRIRRRNSTSST